MEKSIYIHNMKQKSPEKIMIKWANHQNHISLQRYRMTSTYKEPQLMSKAKNQKKGDKNDGKG